MSIVADLHLHSTASDGADSPARVAERAAEAGLRAFALTDHDTTNGNLIARDRAKELGLLFIPGCEMTCYIDEQEFHVLGYGVKSDYRPLLDHCEWCAKVRLRRAEQIGARLEELGMPIDMTKVQAQADAGVVARPHVAQALLDAGYVQTMNEAFDKYLGKGCPAYVAKPAAHPKDVIRLIHEAGGVAVLAHGLIGRGGAWDHRKALVEAGLDGFEVWHSEHNQSDSDTVEAEADRLGLLKTGGSDCHGRRPDKPELMAQHGVDEPRLRRLMQRLGIDAAAL